MSPCTMGAAIRAPLILVALLGGGCTWISTADYEKQRAGVDDDGDGFAREEDCNDANGEIFPGATELWYDGKDEDCLGGDDYDADLDGFVAPTYVGLPTEGVPGSGGLPGGDCDDANNNSYPGATDTWYDGLDTDCAGNDDYDQDADNFVQDADIGKATAGVDNSGNAAAGDCDDADGAVNPEASDTWYDGVDSDCDGRDDFDADEDGYVLTENVGRATTYLEDSTGDLPGGDCDDADGNQNPGVAETWYDGEDQACDGLDDYDRDGDGYVRPGDFGLTTEGVVSGGTLPEGDCDDADALAFPGATESLADTADTDCDGGANTFYMLTVADRSSLLESVTWTSPRDPVFAENSTHTYLSVATIQADVEKATTTTSYFDSALAFQFDLSAATETENISALIDWQRNIANPTYTLTEGHDIVVNNTALYGVIGLQASSSRALRMGGYQFSDATRFGVNYPVGTASRALDDFDDITLAVDATGELHALACEAGTALGQYMRATAVQVEHSTYGSTAQVSVLDASACELHFGADPTGTVLTGEVGSYGTHTFSRTAASFTLAEVSDITTLTPLDITTLEDDAGDLWTLIADDTSASIVVISPSGATDTLAVGQSPVSVSAWWDVAGDGLVIGWATDAGEAWYATGSPTGGYDEQSVAIGFAAESVAVWTDEDGAHLLIAAVGPTDIAIGAADR